MKQGVMPYLAPSDLTTYLGFFFVWLENRRDSDL